MEGYMIAFSIAKLTYNSPTYFSKCVTFIVHPQFRLFNTGIYFYYKF